MEYYLRARLQPLSAQVSVGVTCEQQHLKDQQAGRPNRRRAPEPRQDVFADQRLNLEQQECSAEHRKTVNSHSGEVARFLFSRRVLLRPVAGDIPAEKVFQARFGAIRLD